MLCRPLVQAPADSYLKRGIQIVISKFFWDSEKTVPEISKFKRFEFKFQINPLLIL
jgi:hypothetical protein